MTWMEPADAQKYGSHVLEGDIVRLRALDDADLVDLSRWWSEPEWAVLQQGTIRPRRYEDVAEQFRSWSKNDSGSSVGYSVVNKTTDLLVGHVTLFDAQLPTRAATLAVMIGSEHVSRGYGTDTVRVVANYGFQEMGLNRIELQVHAFNARARAVYSKVGFVEEGIRRQSTFHDGQFHDAVIMAALAEEWMSASSKQVSEN